ncbi:pathogenesis-related protein PR-1 type-like [Wolffia australiana]
MGTNPSILGCACFFALVLVRATQAQTSPQDYLDLHNEARAMVDVGPLVWDETIAAYAQNYANLRSNDCNLIHSGGPYGENLFWGFGADFTGREASELWISEKQYYDYFSNSCVAGRMCGHYTQAVWRNSVRIGCARVQCFNGAIFITCNYDGPGNYVGQRPY